MMAAVRIWNIVIVSRIINGLAEVADFGASVRRSTFNPNLSRHLVSRALKWRHIGIDVETA